MKSVGITGYKGFIGYHLEVLLGKKENIQIIPIEDEFFDHEPKLKEAVEKCDVIIHLAGVNRHQDPQELYRINKKLAHQLVKACEETNHRPYIIFSSSIQEERDNPYGNSKKEARELFINWAKKNNASFTGMLLPNVFGPYGKPFYNSVVATFCYQLTHEQIPKIEIDATLQLIHVNRLVEKIADMISEFLPDKNILQEKLEIPFDKEIKVSDILKKLLLFKEQYMDHNIFPNLSDYFDNGLFTTFLTYLNDTFYPVSLPVNQDQRGYLFEFFKAHSGGQAFSSLTKPGIVRGNHYHRRKVERFCVLAGEAEIKLRKIKTNEVRTYRVSGEKPVVVDMPVLYTHNIKNIGKSDLYTLFWTNEIFNAQDSDTFYEDV